MISFANSRETERKAIARMMPFLEAWSLGAPIKWITDREGQKRRGDCIVTARSLVTIDCELKGVEGSYDRFFIETWSNKAYETPGWLYTSEAHRLLYLYLSDERLFVMDLPKLKVWLIDEGNLEKYPEVPQEKCSQLNDTWGRLVPQRDVRDAIGFRYEGIAPKAPPPSPVPSTYLNDHHCHCGKYGRHGRGLGPIDTIIWFCGEHAP